MVPRSAANADVLQLQERVKELQAEATALQKALDEAHADMGDMEAQIVRRVRLLAGHLVLVVLPSVMPIGYCVTLITA